MGNTSSNKLLNSEIALTYPDKLIFKKKKKECKHGKLYRYYHPTKKYDLSKSNKIHNNDFLMFKTNFDNTVKIINITILKNSYSTIYDNNGKFYRMEEHDEDDNTTFILKVSMNFKIKEIIYITCNST